MFNNKTPNKYINVINKDSALLDFGFFTNKKSNYNNANSLELINGSIKSIIGDGPNSLNELTVAAAAQNFVAYLNKKEIKKNIFITHDGSINGLLFSKVFASVLQKENVNAYFNYDNEPLNNALSVFIAHKSKIEFDYIVTFSKIIHKNHFAISFFDKKGFLLSSEDSQEINALISETSFLNLKIFKLEIPTIEKQNFEEDYMKYLEIKKDISRLNVSITNTYDLNQKILDTFVEQNKINCDFIKTRKIFNSENQITRNSINQSFFKNKDIIFNFNTSINNFELLIKHKKRWKFITLNDFALIYIKYRKEIQDNLNNKKVYSSYFASKYINYFAKKMNLETEEYSILADVFKNRLQEKNLLLATNGSNYFVSDNNPSFCTDPLINIKLVLEVAAHYKEKNKNLFEVLVNIFKENENFHFNSLRESMNFENAIVFFNKIQNLKEIDGNKIIRIKQNQKMPMCWEVKLENKIVIIFQYFKNRNLLISNYSTWDQNNNKKDYIDLVVKEKRIINEISSLNENLDVKKFSLSAFIKYSIFVLLFIILCYVMLTFILDSGRELWKQIKNFLIAETHLAYLLPVFVLLYLFQITIYSIASMRTLKRLNEKVKIRHIFIANFISICISTITPLIYGGETIGYWYLRRKGLNKPSIAAMYLIQSLLTQINFIIFSIIFLPLGYVRFYDIILSQGNGIFIISLVIIGSVIDVFSAVMIALLTFSNKLQQSIANDLKRFIEWLPFIVIKNANEKAANLRYEFSNINQAARKVFVDGTIVENILITIELIFYQIIARIVDWGAILAMTGNMLNIYDNPIIVFMDMIAGQTLVRSVNAVNFLIPGGLGISDWAIQNILVSMFKYNASSSVSGIPEYYNVNVWQALSRIMYTFITTIFSACALLTVFIGESRIDKYNKIKKTLSDEEILKGNVRIKSRFYSIAIIPWILLLVGSVSSWYLIYNFVIR